MLLDKIVVSDIAPANTGVVWIKPVNDSFEMYLYINNKWVCSTNLVIADSYQGEDIPEGKVIYYKDDNMVKFRANITDNPHGESEVVTVGGEDYEEHSMVATFEDDTTLTTKIYIKS